MGKLRSIFAVLSVALLVAGFTSSAFAGEKPKKEKEKKSVGTAQPGAASLEALEETIADLKAQLTELKEQVQKQQVQANATAGGPSTTDKPIASLNPAPSAAAAAAPPSSAAPAPAAPQALAAENPLQLKIGDASITPIGFMDITNTFRSTNAGSSLQTNFGSIPYNNTLAGRLTEDKFSAANSRIGFRVDARVKDMNILGYYEGDFVGGTTGNNTQVSSNSLLYRIRLYWLNVRKGKFEMLAGQSWSMLTPNRKQISALPGDLFYSQVVDVNYMNGLTWGRIPGVRFLYHPNSRVTMGISLENAAQYFGGSGGGGTPTLPTQLATPIASELDQNGSTNGIATPNVHPDIISKIAFDLNSRVHFEVAGVESTVKLFNPLTQQSFTKGGGGGSINGNFEVVKGLRLVTNNFWSDGAGRYLFGVAPDFIVRPDGSPSLIHSGSTLTGFEYQHKNLQLYSYYGGIYIKQNTAIDTNGARIGYGYSGSPNSQNRTTQEGTVGFTQTVWRDAKYGAMQMMFQYAYLFRNPWFVAAGAPKNAHENVGWFNLRYVLPGAPPSTDERR